MRHSYYILGVCWKILSNFAHYFGICLMKYSMYLAHFLDMPTNLLLCVLWAILGYEIYHWSCWLERGKFVSPYVMSGSLSLDLTTSSTNMTPKHESQIINPSIHMVMTILSKNMDTCAIDGFNFFHTLLIIHSKEISKCASDDSCFVH